MGEILQMPTLHDYCEYLGVKMANPLATLVNFSEVAPQHPCRKNYGFYAVFIKDVKCGDLRYGRQYYDYQAGTAVFVAPGQVLGNDDDGSTFRVRGYALLFSPDLVRGTALARAMRDYTFFDYAQNEALHLSDAERKTLLGCFAQIANETALPVDRHSKCLIADSVRLALDYCVRFYDRQFITREKPNHDILTKFEKLLVGYFRSEKPQTLGLPTVQFCARTLGLSPNYFGDLIKKETGKSAREHIFDALMSQVKDRLANDAGATVAEIAYSLGFKYPHHLSRAFKRIVGCTPGEFRERMK